MKFIALWLFVFAVAMIYYWRRDIDRFVRAECIRKDEERLTCVHQEWAKGFGTSNCYHPCVEWRIPD